MESYSSIKIYHYYLFIYLIFKALGAGVKFEEHIVLGYDWENDVYQIKTNAIYCLWFS